MHVYDIFIHVNEYYTHTACFDFNEKVYTIFKMYVCVYVDTHTWKK